MMRLLLMPLLALILLAAPAVSAQDVTSDHFVKGDSFSHTFEGEGRSRFHCHPHPGMGFGDVAVGPASEGGPQTHVVEIRRGADGFEFSETDLTIGAGDTVEWRSVEGTHQIMIWLGGTPTHHDHDDHGHDGDAEESPLSLPLLPLLAASVLLALRRR